MKSIKVEHYLFQNPVAALLKISYDKLLFLTSDTHLMIRLIWGPDWSKWPLQLHIEAVDSSVEDFYFFLEPLVLLSSLFERAFKTGKWTKSKWYVWCNHTVRNLHILSKNSTLISRENCRVFFLVKNSWKCFGLFSCV